MAGAPSSTATGTGALRALRFAAYLVVANALLRLPGHGLRLAVLRHLCGVAVGSGTAVERRTRVTTRGGVTIGSGCNVNGDVVLDGRGRLEIGDLVNISEGVALLTADHDPDSPAFAGRLRPVVVGARSWLATRAMVLPGSTIGEGAVVGAGAVVAGDVPPWTVVAGVPASTVRTRDPSAQAVLPPYRRWLH